MKMTSILPSTFSKSTNFENADHGKNKRSDESGKPEESSGVQYAAYKEHWDFLNDDKRGRRNLKHWLSPKADGGGIRDNLEETQILRTWAASEKSWMGRARTPKENIWVGPTLPTGRRANVPTIKQTLPRTKESKEATQETTRNCPLRAWPTRISKNKSILLEQCSCWGTRR